MRVCTCILSVLILSVNAYGQFNKNVIDYYESVNKGKINYVKKNYSAAITDDLTAFKSMQPHKDDIDFIAYLYSLNYDTVKAMEYYKLSILNGMPADIAMGAGYINVKAGTKDYITLSKSLDSLSRVFDKQSNVQFALLIKELYTNDQFARNLLDYELDSTKVDKKLWQSLLVKIDTTNMVALLDYLNNNNVPSAIVMSSETETEFKLVVHHIIQYKNEGHGNTVVMSNKIRDIIAKAIYSGVLPNNFLYNALDREHNLCCQKQLYGTFYSYDKGHKITYTNIEDVSNVDKRRQQWLLLPLYWSMRFNFDNNFTLPEGYTYEAN